MGPCSLVGQGLSFLSGALHVGFGHRCDWHQEKRSKLRINGWNTCWWIHSIISYNFALEGYLQMLFVSMGFLAF